MAGNEDLREFLRSRRGRVDPADVGLLAGDGPRRVPGLRREELARLAGVSVDYYVRLEQGRATNVSEDVLAAVARALRLGEDETTHLFDLARPTRTRRKPRARPQRVRAGVLALIEGLGTPAFVVGRRSDILATNRMARALLADFDAMPAPERNYARWLFLDPSARELLVDWDDVARDNVATLRMDAGQHPDDPELSALVGELSVKSEAFARWWAAHDVLRRSHGTKRHHHPIVGALTISYEALPLPDDPDQVLFIYSVEPGSPSDAAMRLLSSWTLENAADRVPRVPRIP